MLQNVKKVSLKCTSLWFSKIPFFGFGYISETKILLVRKETQDCLKIIRTILIPTKLNNFCNYTIP